MCPNGIVYDFRVSGSLARAQFGSFTAARESEWRAKLQAYIFLNSLFV